jgi:drug/metabolite transporter (DMT)-like permease
MKLTSRLGPDGAALFDVTSGVMLSGIGPILVRESPVGPAATAFWRFALAAPVAFRLARAGENLPKTAIAWSLLAGILLGGDIVLWNRSILTTSIMEATVLVMIYPFLVAMFGWILFRDKVSPPVILGAGAAFLGMVFLGLDSTGAGSSAPGNILALAAAFFYAGSLLVTSRLCRIHPPALVTAWSVLGAALTALPFGFLEDSFLPHGPIAWSAILTYGAITVISYLLVARGLRLVPAAQAAILGFGMPLISTVLSAFIYAEIPSFPDMLGASLVLLGIAIAVKPARAPVTT